MRTTPARATRPALGAAAAVAAVVRMASRPATPGGRAGRSRFVAIDGASGVGKSTFATALLSAWRGSGAMVVRLDDVYPGWFGLHSGAVVAGRTVVRPLAGARPGSLARWDWTAGRVSGRERIRPGHPVIVEGCGAFAAIAGVPAVRVWIDAPDDRRRDAALARDGGRFDPYWELWERQWRSYAARTGPRGRADVIVTGRPTAD